MAPETPFQLQNLTKDSLGQVAEIHQKAFPQSYLSKIGPKAIIKYYAWHMDPPNICYTMGAFQGERLIGFSFAGVFRNAEVFFLRDNWLYFLGVFFFHPALLFNREISERFKKMLGYIREYLPLKKTSSTKQAGSNPERFGLLSIAVDPDRQRLGIGQALMDAVERRAVENAYPKIFLSVHPDNLQAVSFYEKSGWRKAFYDQNQPWQGYMEKNLEG